MSILNEKILITLSFILIISIFFFIAPVTAFGAITNTSIGGWSAGVTGEACYQYGVDEPLTSFEFSNAGAGYVYFIFYWDDPSTNSGGNRDHNSGQTSPWSYNTDLTTVAGDAFPARPVHIWQVGGYADGAGGNLAVDFIIQDDPCEEEGGGENTATTTATVGESTIIFGMGIFLVILGMGLTGFIWNSFNSKKRWQ